MYLCKFDTDGKRTEILLDGVHFKTNEKDLPILQGYIEVLDDDYAYYAGNKSNGNNGTGFVKEVADSIGNRLKTASCYIFNRCLSGRESMASSNGEHPCTIKDLFNGKYKDFRGCSMDSRGKIVPNGIVGVTYSSVMPVYEVMVNNGMIVMCTMNHKFPTQNGIKLLSELHVGDTVYTMELFGSPLSTHRIASIEYVCDEDCYDVEMEVPNHNFVTGEGIVVCNSHNIEY